MTKIYTAILTFKKNPCFYEAETFETKAEAKEKIKQWKKECGESNPYIPEFEINEQDL